MTSDFIKNSFVRLALQDTDVIENIAVEAMMLHYGDSWPGLISISRKELRPWIIETKKVLVKCLK